MADLYNLLDELEDHENQFQQPDENPELAGNEDGVSASQDGEAWGDVDHEVPDALLEAAAKKRQSLAGETAATSMMTMDSMEKSSFIDYELDGDSQVLESKQRLLADLQYTKLQKMWIQEMHSPEILPYDQETINGMLESLQEREDEIDEYVSEGKTGNANMDALFASILRIDSERVKFLVTDVLKQRLHKIEAHPLYMRDMAKNLSDNEIEFLKEYGSAMEHHLSRTVLDNFPKDFIALDDSEMIDKPDLDQYVFVKCTKDIMIGLEEKTSGDFLICRYSQILEYFKRGEVEMLI